MDMNMPVLKDEQCIECTCVDIIDRISKFPDEILGKILSYLPTKEAVATSVLSKRWEHLWTLTSDLDFSDNWLMQYKDENDRMIKMMSFLKYVDRVIFYHCGMDIRKCDMSFYSEYVASSVYNWIFAMITCNVQQLSLCCFEYKRGTYYQLPWMLFSSNTLVVLRISGTFVINLPTDVCLPCLKLLQIEYSDFVDDVSMERLFSSCPVLEELTIRGMKNGLKIMNISVPSLKRLTISVGLFTTVQTNINAPYLEYVEIHHGEENAPRRYSVNFTSSLIHAKLEGFDIYLLNAISQVECLTLTANDTSLEDIIHNSTLPIFKNLKTLKLLVGDGWPSPTNWRVLPNLLHSSPNLQVLIFPKGLVTHTLDQEDYNRFYWLHPEIVPECLSMNLKIIEIFEFVGLQDELQLLNYFLEFGRVLEKIIIHSENPMMEKKVEGGLRTSCSTCQVIFTN
ncbi:F-box/FBD/LRR-repeat protein At4g26340-like isoform X2 [Euphorbia lathyris]